MKTLSILGVLLLGACAGDLPGGGKAEYVYVGCNEVTTSPSNVGDMAIGPFGVKTSYVFFKQINSDGTVSTVTTAKSC